jgi:hypothetical protein
MDTDVLNLVFPWLVIMFWIVTLKQKHYKSAIVGAFVLLGFRMWYHSSAPILAAMVGGLFLTIFLFYRKEYVGWFVIVLSVIAILPIPYQYALMIMIAIIILFNLFQKYIKNIFISKKIYLALFSFGTIAIIYLFDFDYFIERAVDYIAKPDTLTLIGKNSTYYFTNVLTTVKEAEGAPIWKLNPEFSFLIFYIVPALIGYILMLFKYRVLLLTLPLLALGFLSGIAGARFAMYASPALALGFGYISIVYIRQIISHKTIQLVISSTLILTVIVLMIFNIQKLNYYLKPYYFFNSEVKALKLFSNNISSKDLVLSWWDYGWPMWYYTGYNNTLIDNGLHRSDTYLIANQLLSPNYNFIANSAKYANNIKQKGIAEVLPYILDHTDISNKFSIFSDKNISIKSSGSTYFLLHRNMLTILPTIASIANRNIHNGIVTEQPKFSIVDLKRPFKGDSPFVYGKDFTLDLRNGVIYGANGVHKQVGGVAVSEHGKQKAAKLYDKSLDYYIIIYDKNKILYIDKKLYNSFLIQALVLDKYKTKQFKKIIDTGIMKIFKVY